MNGTPHLPSTDSLTACFVFVYRPQAMAQAGVTANDVQVIELHDCFSANELITYEALGLCAPGKAGALIDAGDNTYGGKWVVNPSGGLISKGHPLGATGLAQCAELVWQLRGEADKRQVKNVKYALQHNLGLGGAAVVAVYKKPTDLKATPSALTSFQRGASFIGAAPKVVQPAPSAGSGSAAAPAKPASGGSDFAAEAIFAQMKANLSADIVKKVRSSSVDHSPFPLHTLHPPPPATAIDLSYYTGATALISGW